jgi:hypothetical protein
MKLAGTNAAFVQNENGKPITAKAAEYVKWIYP